MIDTKGIGKPTIFSHDEAKFAVWSKKLENFVSGGFDERARRLMVHASDLGKEPLKEDDLKDEFDERTLEILPRLQEQLYTILCGVTDGEAFVVPSTLSPLRPHDRGSSRECPPVDLLSSQS